MGDSPRRRVPGGSPYEPVIGISRAVRAGTFASVAGTAPPDAEGRTFAPGWEAVARVHGEFFRDVRPASALVQVTSCIDPDRLVEVEADAVVAD